MTKVTSVFFLERGVNCSLHWILHVGKGVTGIGVYVGCMSAVRTVIYVVVLLNIPMDAKFHMHFLVWIDFVMKLF